MLQSTDVVFSVIQKEFDYERDRKGKLESKAGIILSLMIAIQTFLITNIKFPKDIVLTKMSTLISFIVLVILIVAIIVLFIIAMINIIEVLKLNEYKQVDVATCNRELCQFPKDTTTMAFIEKYRDALIHNRSLNDSKSKNYQLAVTTVLLMFLLTLFVYIMLFILK